jgi:hypothetical protein
MRTIAAGWALPHKGNRKGARWHMGAALQHVRSAWLARRHAATAPSGRGPRDGLVQADVAAFISAFMRIG